MSEEHAKTASAAPLVSVGVPVYNAADSIEAVLEGLLSQTYENLEIIVSDNASTDDTAKKVRALAQRDNRVRLEQAEKNQGPIWNFNRTAALATGKYFLWAAADDRRDQRYVEACVKALETEADAVLCHTYTRACIGDFAHDIYIQRLDRVADIDSPVRRFMRMRRYFPAVALYGTYRVEAMRRVPSWGNHLGSDVLFAFELCLRGKIIQVPETLFDYMGKSVQRSVDQEYAFFNEGRSKPRLYFPFLELLGKYLAVVWRAPLGVSVRLWLCLFLCFFELRNILVKALYRVADRLWGIERLPGLRGWAVRTVGRNPDCQFTVPEASLPPHVRPDAILSGKS